jgi:DNA replication protein DnaC
MILFDKIKTNDPFIDAITTTLVLTGITYFFQIINQFMININTKTLLLNIVNYNYFYTKNSIEYEGKISLSTNYYDTKLRVSSAFTDRFKALWEHIIKNISGNRTINYIKEFGLTNDTDSKNRERDVGIYMVTQKEQFLISKEYEIYAYTYMYSEVDETEDKKSYNKVKTSNKIERIKIELFSYKSNVQQIKCFVDSITNTYLSTIENSRETKRFIYTLVNTKWEDNKYEMWEENVFLSTRTFNNIFFINKSEVIKNLNFFNNNRDWYFEKGIPYSLGIGLHGPPGTGKTSLIKAIANYTNRHIIVISLKLIKTKKQLDSIFFEERYNLDNKKDSISFDKKIIVFEDIDCIGNIVMNRENKKRDNLFNNLDLTANINTKITVNELLEKITGEMGNERVYELPKLQTDDLPITLDDILNLWDGIRETPGRIMIISSNHYFELDPALIRPGRIDMTLELSYVNYEVIKDIYRHLFNEEIDDIILQNIKENFYTPAELINIYINEGRDPKRFITRLLLNQHV